MESMDYFLSRTKFYKLSNQLVFTMNGKLRIGLVLGSQRGITLSQTTINQRIQQIKLGPIFQGTNQEVKPFPWSYYPTTDNTCRKSPRILCTMYCGNNMVERFAQIVLGSYGSLSIYLKVRESSVCSSVI